MNVIQMNATMNVDTEEYRKERFEEFWKYYPVHKVKAKARALFMRITEPGGFDSKTLNKDSGMYEDIHLEATCDEIVEGARRYRFNLPRISRDSYTPDTTYCPLATTWLNQGRWEDE